MIHPKFIPVIEQLQTQIAEALNMMAYYESLVLKKRLLIEQLLENGELPGDEIDPVPSVVKGKRKGRWTDSQLSDALSNHKTKKGAALSLGISYSRFIARCSRLYLKHPSRVPVNGEETKQQKGSICHSD